MHSKDAARRTSMHLNKSGCSMVSWRMGSDPRSVSAVDLSDVAVSVSYSAAPLLPDDAVDAIDSVDSEKPAKGTDSAATLCCSKWMPF